MKMKLLEVVAIGERMTRIEQAGIKFNPMGTVRYGRHRNAVFAHVEPYVAQVRKLYDEGEKNEANFLKAQDTAAAAVNGEMVELTLPPPVPASWITHPPEGGPEVFQSMMKLVDVVFAETESPPA